MRPDIVIPVREGDRNPELRYALRAIAAHVPHRQVWIAGHIPPWVRDVGHVPNRQTATKYENSRSNWKAAVDHAEVSDDFLIFNDDFFAMRRVQRVPPMHRGLLADVERHFLRRVRAGRYLMGMRQTADLLADLGVERPLSYELHVPMLLNKARYLEVWEVANRIQYPHSRTLYGNYWKLGGTQIADPKVLTRGSGYPKGESWLSTMPETFERGQVGAYIRRTFPRPGPYETGRR
ncbi:hypothetical protein [Streptomyces anulatus]|uniref:hypothetical protein n=1 Tax=Streptomyces anulatus TaxID=1892 RepID=UPI003680B66C